MIHQKENSSDTESFFKENGERFSGDCETAMRLMYSGIRLTSKDCWEKYGIHDRRLRNCYAACPNTVKREWKLNEKGKRMYVEYFIPVFKPPTKSELQEWFSEYQKEGAPIRFIQSNLFL